MRRQTTIAVWLLLVMAIASGAMATEAVRTFMNGTEAYRNQNWPAAIAAFERLVEAGVNNGKLYYNLGNAYLKNDDLGRALLWYERALKHIPDDPDLRFNHDYALTLTKDEGVQKESPLLRILFFWKYQLPPSIVRWAAVLLNAILWTVLIVMAVRKKRLLRPGIVLIAAIALIFTATAAYNYVDATRRRDAIILPEKVAVRSGFSDSATQLFVLHAGTKVRVERESETHLMVRYTADKIGWIKRSEAGII